MMKRLLVVCMLILTLAACASSPEFGTASDAGSPASVEDYGGEADFDDFSADEEVAAEPQSSRSSDGVQVQERLIIRTGNLAISSDDTLATRDDIEELVEQYAAQGAFIVSVEQYGGTDEGNPNIDMQIRVPSDNFSTVMDELAAMGVDVFNRSESGQDVTEEYVDLSARIESLEAARARLLDLIEQAETTEALLQAEAQLTQREQEIEALKGRLQFLEESAALSSISISISPTRLSQPIDTRWRPAETFREAFDRLVDSLRGFADFAIIFVISVLPWLLLFFGFAYIVVRGIVWGIRSLRRNKPHAEEES